MGLSRERNGSQSTADTATSRAESQVQGAFHEEPPTVSKRRSTDFTKSPACSSPADPRIGHREEHLSEPRRVKAGQKTPRCENTSVWTGTTTDEAGSGAPLPSEERRRPFPAGFTQPPFRVIWVGPTGSFEVQQGGSTRRQEPQRSKRPLFWFWRDPQVLGRVDFVGRLPSL